MLCFLCGCCLRAFFPPTLQVYDIEKMYACTATAVEVVEEGDDGDAGAKGAAVLCVEVANWRSKQKLVRLRFGLSTSFACCVGAPEVEVRTIDRLIDRLFVLVGLDLSDG